MSRFLIATLAVALSIGSLQASERPFEISRIVSQQQQIRIELIARSGRYKDMPSVKRDEILARQNKLLAMLDGKATSEDLTEQERMSAFNTLEWIEAAINNAEDERMICRREKTLGSQRVTRACRTQSQMRADRERANEVMEDRTVNDLR